MAVATLEYFRDSVFNHPTISEIYKHATVQGLSKL